MLQALRISVRMPLKPFLGWTLLPLSFPSQLRVPCFRLAQRMWPLKMMPLLFQQRTVQSLGMLSLVVYSL